ncbi:MAG: hypothetical protein R6X33_16465 [Candidatus Brocadiia bacterium]
MDLAVAALLFVTIASLTLAASGGAAPVPPYPPGPVIAGMEFDTSTIRTAAPGSDNWAVTWADDDHQYTSWGDGGGFGGTNEAGRISLGFGRVEGGPRDYRCFNVWGGKDPVTPAEFEGKCHGLLSIDGMLYAWCTARTREQACPCDMPMQADTAGHRCSRSNPGRVLQTEPRTTGD